MEAAEIGVDLGATRIKAVLVDKTGTVLHQQYTSTHDGDSRIWKNAIATIVADLRKKSGNQARVGIAAPGLPNADHSAIAVMPGRMQGLENLIWKDLLGIETVVLNDAVAAMIAEAKFGAAKDRKHVVMLTLGTGVGGAIMIDGKPYLGAFNKAGHIGHMVINDQGDAGVTGTPGSLEDSIGNATVSKRSQGRFSSTHGLLKAVRNGDGFANEVWTTSLRKLAVGIVSITNILSPEVIVLGGGITEAGKDLFEPLERLVAEYEWRAGGNRVEIVKAQQGDLAGAIGAACYAGDVIKGLELSAI
ncbi:MAG TPA: ROK family protein [Cyclobacteriaceae bacterium]